MSDQDSIIGVIPARAGSRRLPGKNLRPMAGRPMMGWTLEAARASSALDRLLVTSDDEAVLDYARAEGVEAVRRPASLAGDDSPVADAVLHALEAAGGGWTHVVLLQPTSPLRRAGDIDAAVALCLSRGAAAVVSAAPALEPAGFHHRLDRTGVLAPLEPQAAGAAPVVRLNGAVYVVRTETLRRERSFRPPGALAWLMPPERSWDVDSLEEFAACEARLRADGAG